MQSDFRIEKAAFLQARSFLNEHQELLAGVNASDARTALDHSLDGLTTGEEEQSAHRRTSRESRIDTSVARERLLKQQMRAVAAAARLKAEEEPKLRAVVAPRGNASLAVLLESARVMVGDTAAYTHLLAPVVGPNYLVKLRASIAAVERAQERGRASRAQLTAATVGVKRALDLGRLAMRVLHPLVSEALEQEPMLLAEWNARRKKTDLSRAGALSSTRFAAGRRLDGEAQAGSIGSTENEVKAA
jgi:hypothetical protein